MVDQYRLEGRYDDSLAYAKRRLRLEPDNPEFHLDRGMIYTDGLANYEQAINDFKNALELCERQQADDAGKDDIEAEDWRP